MKLKDILQNKGSKAVTIAPTASVADGIRAMYDNNVGSVLITHEDNRLAGIFTERDVFNLCASGRGGQLDDLAMEQHMTRDVVVAAPEDTADQVLTTMTARRFRRMPVVNDGVVLGVLSIGDLVKAKLEETVDEAEALRQYIAS